MNGKDHGVGSNDLSNNIRARISNTMAGAGINLSQQSLFANTTCAPGIGLRTDLFPSRRIRNKNEIGTTDTQAMLVDEWNQLSSQEREQILEELHGVSSGAIEENPMFVNQCLLDMEEEIKHIRKRNAYDRALFLSPKYVKDRDFRLMFLRAESFHPRNAAYRLVNFFDFKLELFGIDKLGKRKITQEDLDKDDMYALRKGRVQILPQKDASGRAVLVVSGKNSTPINQCRVAFYEIMNALEDVETQKKGLVCIYYNFYYPSNMKAELTVKGLKFVQTVPWRTAALHFCSTQPLVSAFVSFVQFAMGRAGRLRFRAHHGSALEIQYALLTFGIPTKEFPIDMGGEPRLEKYHQRLKEREAQELDFEDWFDTRIYCPSPLDVLCGRGKPFQQHAGNVCLAELIEKHQDVYRMTKRGGKSEVSEDILQKVREYDGRFLKKKEGDDEWQVVDDDEAREKVSQGFRNVFKKAAWEPIPILESRKSFENIIERDIKRLKIYSDTASTSTGSTDL